MLAKDMMTTSVVTVRPDSTIKQAMKLLVEIEISGLIVTDEQENVVGVITEKDILVALDFLGNANAPISDYINRNVISVAEDTPFEEVSKTLVQGDIRRVPVVRDNKVVGVVSRRDLLKVVLERERPQA